MAFYLVTADPVKELLPELKKELRKDAFKELKPFGKTLTRSLKNAKLKPDGKAIWEEEDYCDPPLAQERKAVLDKYFVNIQVEKVNEGKGWDKIKNLPDLFRL